MVPLIQVFCFIDENTGGLRDIATLLAAIELVNVSVITQTMLIVSENTEDTP